MFGMTEQDKFWLVGWLEGEGSFLCGPPSDTNMPSVVGCSTDEDIIARVAKLFGVSYHESKKKSKSKRHKKAWGFAKRGYDAVEFMKEIKPYMSIRRQTQIDRVVASYVPNKKKTITDEQVRQIKALCQTNMTQAEVAKMFNITREVVNKIHRNKYPKRRAA